MNWQLIRTIYRVRRAGLSRLRKATIPTRLECIGGECGLCCEVMGDAVVVDGDEATKIGTEWIVFAESTPVLRSEEGACCFLKKRLCLIYSKRPRGCQEYPWYNIDGILYYDAGCPGIKHDRDERPGLNDITPLKAYFQGLPKVVLWVVKKILTLF